MRDDLLASLDSHQRRNFLKGLAAASVLAALTEGTPAAALTRALSRSVSKRAAHPNLTEFERKQLEKIVDAVVPPTLSVRKKMKALDPDFSPASAFETFIYRLSPQYTKSIQSLLGLLETLPTIPGIGLKPAKKFSEIE